MRRPSSSWAGGRFLRPVNLRLSATLAVSCAALAGCGGSTPGSPAATAAGASTSTSTASAPATKASTTAAAKPSSGKSAPPATVKRSTGARPVTASRLGGALAQLRSCMRQNGAPLPQPGASRSSSQRPIDTTTPQFKAALAKCRPALIAALRPKPTASKPQQTTR
jgi:hypothetical protein